MHLSLYPSALLLSLAATLLPIVTGCKMTALPPSQDPWYQAPPGFEETAPGTILRVRPDPRLANLSESLDSLAGAYHILYRSTDAAARPSWAVTTLLVPTSPSKDTKLLSYQIPYNSADVDASPSFLLDDYLRGGPVIPVLKTDLGPALARGWLVSVPDFEGPQAAFGLCLRAGYAVLDGLRAVLASEHARSGAAARSALWGYSYGSAASGFAAELQPAYAPELALGGAALGGVLANATASLFSASGTLYAGVIPSGALGSTAEAPAARADLVGRLNTAGPRNATGFLAALRMRVDEVTAAFAYQDIGAYFAGADGLAGFVAAPAFRAILAANGQMGVHGAPRMPVFAYHAVGDEIASIHDAEKLVRKYGEAGARVLLQRNTVGDHVTEPLNGGPRALKFITQVLDGELGDDFPASGYRIEDVTVDLS